MEYGYMNRRAGLQVTDPYVALTFLCTLHEIKYH